MSIRIERAVILSSVEGGEMKTDICYVEQSFNNEKLSPAGVIVSIDIPSINSACNFYMTVHSFKKFLDELNQVAKLGYP